MICGLSLSAAACSAATSSTARKALSVLRKPICARFSSCSMKLGGELAAHPAVQAGAEDLGNLVAGQPPQAELAAALEQLMDGKVALEDEVATILDLGDRVKAREIELL